MSRDHSHAWPGWAMDWPPPTVVLVMAEAAGTALWNRSPDRDPFADDYVLDAEVLGVTPELAEQLDAWNVRYDWNGNGNDPAWWDEGWLLARLLQREFDSRGLVVRVLFHDADGREPAVEDRRRRPRR